MPDSSRLYAPAEIERLTGIPMNTLRAWERRYGVPKPRRGGGGHRMYTEGDLETLQFLRKQVAAGVAISHAIASWRDQQPASLDMHPDALVDAFIAAIERLDERRADKVLSDAFAFHTVERVCVQVIAPALARIGEAWATGSCSVAVEHFATMTISAQLYSLMRAMPAPRGRPLIFVACVPGEQHALPALMLTVLLRRAGWRALFFGADLPLDDLIEIVPDLQPDALILSASLSQWLPKVQEQVRLMRRAGLKQPIILGGRALEGDPELAEKFGCLFLGHDMLAAIGKLEDSLLKLGIAAH